jgi:thiosulfate/3-mercaptopyruvate sulfurtransferase
VKAADALIDVAELADRLAGPSAPIVLDVRWRLGGPPGKDEYLNGHIPGAVFLDLDEQLTGPPGAGGRHPLPDPVRLQGELRGAGLRDGYPVVVYDHGDGMPAARAWWTLRWAGLADVRVLDGGFAAWTAGDARGAGFGQRSSAGDARGAGFGQRSSAGDARGAGSGGRSSAAGRPTEPGRATLPPGDITVRPGGLPVVDAAGAAALAEGGTLLDARAAARFRGETEPIDPVAGHIPGARNLPAAELVGADGRLLPPGALRERFRAAGVPDAGPVGAYCGSGVTAAQTVLALTVAGYPDPALYVGSWSDWITNPERPVATA